MISTRLTIVGRSNIGKTRVACLTAPDPLLIQADPGGAESVPELEKVADISLEENPVQAVEKVLQSVLEKEVECKTIIWDGFSWWLRRALNYSMETFDARKSKEDAGRMGATYDDYDYVLSAGCRISAKLDRLKKHVVYICLRREQTIKKGRSEITYYEPAAMGQTKTHLIGVWSSFACYMKDVLREGGGKEAVWDFEHEHMGKKRAPIGAVMVPNFAYLLYKVMLARGMPKENVELEMQNQYGDKWKAVAEMKYSDIVK